MAIRAASVLAALLGPAPPVLAEDCRLALVLALDVSSSVDRTEHQLQRRGLAQALMAPEVVRAFLAGEPVALYVFEWSGPASQTSLLSGWVLIDTEDDLDRVAALLVTRPRSGSDDPHPSTALGVALSFAAQALKEGPSCWARTVDVSGDGESNDGISPAGAYATAPLDDVTVNALVVGGTLDARGQPQNTEDLVAWFHAEVLHGSGAFCIRADGYEDYERAMSIKLVREVQAPMVAGAEPPMLVLAAGSID